MNLPKPFFVLAPMDDVTDLVFRQVVASCAAPDLYFTEFTNVDGLQSPGRPRVAHKLKAGLTDRPLIAHIWGLEPENFYQTASELADAFDDQGQPLYAGIDLNMGCPVKDVVNNGACSGLINNRPLAGEIIEAVQQGANGKLPVSVKTRLGFNEVDFSWHEFLLGFDLSMLTVHGRTRKEMSKVPAHWDDIGRVRELRDQLAPQTKIVGNGDVLSRQQGLELAEQYGLDGIMIGRGIFQDPYVFAEASPWPTMGKRERLTLYKKHIELFVKEWPNGERRVNTLGKFCKVYVNGFDGAKELRERLMAAQSPAELLQLLDEAVY